jgi:hypothetical protein
MPAQFNNRADIGEARAMRRSDQRAGQAIVVEMNCLAATIANQKYAVMLATGMAVGDIGIGAFDPARKIGAHEQIQDTVDAIGSDPLAASRCNALGDVIGGGRLTARCESGKNIGAHVSPLLARLHKRCLGGGNQPCAGMFAMMMTGHGRGYRPPAPRLQSAWCKSSFVLRGEQPPQCLDFWGIPR